MIPALIAAQASFAVMVGVMTLTELWSWTTRGTRATTCS